MYGEMMSYYGLTKDLNKADYFETDGYKKTLHSIKIAIKSGGIIALTGLVGSGKTTALRRIQQSLREESKVAISKSLSTDKRRVSTNTLYTALFSDLATEKDFKMPTQPEKRERKMQELIKKLHKPVAMFIDEAHELHWRTLIGLKHLIETIEDANGTLAIIIAGHPMLGNELRRPALEEIGARAKLFTLDGLGAHKRQYLEWVLDNCSHEKVKPHDILSKEALDLFTEHLITPLQMAYYLSQALEKGFQAGEKPVGIEVAKAVLAPDLNAIGPKLARHGYNLNTLCELFNARRSEVKSYLRGQLAAGRAEEFTKEIYKIGLL